MRYWLYGTHFVLETDANVLVAQLNKAATDLLGALVTRWLAYIHMFDFEVRHVPGHKHTAADGLSRRPRTESDNLDEKNEVDIEEFLDTELAILSIVPIGVTPEDPAEASDFEIPVKILNENYSEESQRIAKYLTTLCKPEGLIGSGFRQFKKKALKYAVRDALLFRRESKNIPSQLVVDSGEEQAKIIKALHDKNGHKGRESTYRKIADRYYWEGCYVATKAYIAGCKICQRRDSRRQEEALYPTWESSLFEKIGLDVIHMPQSDGKNYLVVAREDLSGWPEARALSKASSEAIAKFLWEEVVSRHGCFGKLVVDGGPENKDYLESFIQRYGINRVQVSAYHPQANGMVERGHRSIVEALVRMTNGGITKWTRNLPSVLLAERTTVHNPTGKTPFGVIYGREAVLPVELEHPTWRVLKWSEIRDRADLLATRALQLQFREEEMREIALRKQSLRQEGKETFDSMRQIRKGEIKKGDVVLKHNPQVGIDRSRIRKLAFR